MNLDERLARVRRQRQALEEKLGRLMSYRVTLEEREARILGMMERPAGQRNAQLRNRTG